MSGEPGVPGDIGEPGELEHMRERGEIGGAGEIAKAELAAKKHKNNKRGIAQAGIRVERNGAGLTRDGTILLCPDRNGQQISSHVRQMCVPISQR